MINSALQTQENINITCNNNEREIGEDGNSGQVNLEKLIGIRREGNEKGGNFRKQMQFNALCIVLLFN